MSHLKSWAAILGGDVSGLGVICPGPGHSRRDRSLSVTPSVASPGFITHSFAGDDWRTCHEYVGAKLGIEPSTPRRAPTRLNAGALAAIKTPEPVAAPNHNMNRAGTIWRESAEVKGTLAESYLASRGLPLDDGEDWHCVAGAGDLRALIGSIEASDVRPGAIAIDTVAQSIGAGDENNTGMVQFAANITALANHFECLVAAVHHVGLGDEKRLRGHSSFLGALDVSILSERKEGALSATLTVMKLKDEESSQKFTVHLARVVICKDSDGEDVSTLIVESVEPGATEGAKAPRTKSIPRAQRLLITMVEQAIGEDETAKMIRPFADGPHVKAVPDEAVRRRYYVRLAENAKPGEDPQKLADRQRQAFYRAINDALKALILMASERDGTRFLWLP
jgi:hypothetical protein